MGLMALFVGVMYLVGVVVLAALAPASWWAIHAHPSKLIHLALSIFLACVYFWLRRKQHPTWLLWTLDGVSTVSILVAVGAGVALAPTGLHLELFALLFMILTLVLRAAIVPSTPRWTALVGAVGAVPIVVGALRHGVSSGLSGFLTPGIVGVTLTIWCLATVALTATVSRIVYGLVRQVREAMRFGQYTLGEKLGEGGMGAVYRAEHAMLRRPTAVKLLLPDRLDREGLLRFEREVQLTSQLSHPNTVAIYDYGRTPNGVVYYAMEYLDGASLDRLVAREGPQAPKRVLRILEQAAGSLAEAHRVGLVHRDVKPGNLLLCKRGGIEDFVKVIDFGLVKSTGGTEPALSQVGTIAGTPLFMAPESASDPEKVSARTDTYALGAVAYFLLTGVPPFDGQSFVEICGHHLHSTPVPPSERLGKGVPVKLEALILRCLAKAPEARPDDHELAALLAECFEEAEARTSGSPAARTSSAST